MSTTLDRKIINTLESGEVERYHAAPGVKKQTDAQHAWGVAVLAMYIIENPSVELLKECILHDSGELITGDIPFTFKREDPELGEHLHEFEETARNNHMLRPSVLGAREQAVLKLCDTLEGLHWCFHHESASAKGFHRAQVHERWVGAYNRCYDKFYEFLTKEEWRRANDLFEAVGGRFFLAALAAIEHKNISSHT